MTWFDILKESNFTLQTQVMSEYLKMLYTSGNIDILGIDIDEHMGRFTDGNIETSPPMEPPELVDKFKEWKAEFKQPMWKDRVPLEVWQKEMDAIDDAIQALYTGLVGQR